MIKSNNVKLTQLKKDKVFLNLNEFSKQDIVDISDKYPFSFQDLRQLSIIATDLYMWNESGVRACIEEFENIQNKDSKVEETILEKMEMVKFPPFYYHALESLEDSECLVLTSKGRAGQDYEEDTIRVNDIENYEVL